MSSSRHELAAASPRLARQLVVLKAENSELRGENARLWRSMAAMQGKLDRMQLAWDRTDKLH